MKTSLLICLLGWNGEKRSHDILSLHFKLRFVLFKEEVLRGFHIIWFIQRKI